jgi:hypothetical protein
MVEKKRESRKTRNGFMAYWLKILRSLEDDEGTL